MVWIYYLISIHPNSYAILKMLGQTGASCKSFYTNPCCVKRTEYLKFLFISLGSPLVTLERDIFKMTKAVCEKIESK